MNSYSSKFNGLSKSLSLEHGGISGGKPRQANKYLKSSLGDIQYLHTVTENEYNTPSK